MTNFSNRILSWYDQNARVLPWRTSPLDRQRGRTPNAYEVWLSEIMLQQTTIATVKPYYERFLTAWPTVSALAAASEEDVLSAWAGLGYYSRARNLKKCADVISREFGGRFPTTAEELQSLPGIGDYTSAAIAAIAFDEAAPAVDGNIERVITRYTLDPTPVPKVKSACRTFMRQHISKDRPGDFVQAMMDLGSMICKPKSPLCPKCPVNHTCAAEKTGKQELFPVKPKKKIKPTRRGAAFVARNSEGSVWLVRRQNSGLLAGMSGVPTTDWSSRQDGALGADSAWVRGDWQSCPIVRHTFTHFHLELEIWAATIETVPGDGWWAQSDELAHEALPTLMKKVISASSSP